MITTGRIRHIIFSALILAFLPTEGQSIIPMKWEKKSTPKIKQKSNIKWFESKTDLKFLDKSADPFKAYYVVLDSKDPTYEIQTSIADKPLPFNEFWQNPTNRPFIIVNGGFFGPNTSYSLLISDKQVLAKNADNLKRDSETYLVSRPAFYKKTSGEYAISWVYTDHINNSFVLEKPINCNVDEASICLSFLNNLAATEMEMAIGGGPMLIKDSKIIEDYSPERFLDDVVSSKAPRTAIGLTKNQEIIILIVDGRQEHSVGVSLQTLSALLQDLGCEYAMNLDGGSSSFLVINDTLINHPSREIPPRVSTFISIGTRKMTND